MESRPIVNQIVGLSASPQPKVEVNEQNWLSTWDISDRTESETWQQTMYLLHCFLHNIQPCIEMDGGIFQIQIQRITLKAFLWVLTHFLQYILYCIGLYSAGCFMQSSKNQVEVGFIGLGVGSGLEYVRVCKTEFGSVDLLV